ncbi:hypothetical protein [Roseimaritima sediminicola]|uniref:hypothetical protein n=1 Tax=Roseimaritima sediminicola TaxID=2662066 RepID=UPI00129849E5|nr:hypothetical protein [Roseimaritima sediminicola]
MSVDQDPPATPDQADSTAAVSDSAAADPARRGGWGDHVLYGGASYYFTSLIVVVAVMFGSQFVITCMRHHDAHKMDRSNLVERFAPWDGVWYHQIASEGYSYDPERMSNVAFYPLYPMSGRLFSVVTGLQTDVSLLAVSHLFLLGAFVVFSKYLSERPTQGVLKHWRICLIVFGLFPTTFYFRMSYSESTFLCFVLLAMYGMQRRWPLWVVAILVGATTAARPVGLAAVLPFWWTLWQQSSSPRSAAVKACLLTPVCVWGLAAYMLYQHIALGDALAFIQTQTHWQTRTPPASLLGRLAALVTLEPFWAVYQPDCECYWATAPPVNTPEFNLHFFNPLIVMATWLLVAFGAVRRWLTPQESLLSVGLLGIPYVTHAYHACMASEARYAAAAFPVYILVGMLVDRLPREAQAVLFGMMAVLMAIGAMMFTGWYWYF